MQEQETICARFDDGILRIALDRPEVRNAFNPAMIAELTDVFTTDYGPTLRCVTLSGNGRSFSAGADMNWMRETIAYTRQENIADAEALMRLFDVIDTCPVPVIAAVHGAVMGGAVGLTSVCDRVIAEKQTKFALSEVRLGLIPAVIGPFVMKRIGAAQCRALFLSGERFDAAYAQKIGLIHDCVEGDRGIRDRLEECAQTVAQCSPHAVRAAKAYIHSLVAQDNEALKRKHAASALADIRVSEEAQEGLSAFLEKRKPAWIS